LSTLWWATRIGIGDGGEMWAFAEGLAMGKMGALVGVVGRKAASSRGDGGADC